MFPVCATRDRRATSGQARVLLSPCQPPPGWELLDRRLYLILAAPALAPWCTTICRLVYGQAHHAPPPHMLQLAARRCCRSRSCPGGLWCQPEKGRVRQETLVCLRHRAPSTSAASKPLQLLAVALASTPRPSPMQLPLPKPQQPPARASSSRGPAGGGTGHCPSP